MAHKLKKFCKITRYIEQIDGELSQMISDLCLERLFVPRGVNGITFLYPKEESYRKEIIAAAYGSNPEKAIQMLESLIVLDHLPRPGDFVLKKDDIPNALRQRIEVASADVSSVKLTCGATLTPDPGFAPISTRENMAVYQIKGPQIPLNGPKATMKYASKRRSKNSKLGGYDKSEDISEFYKNIKETTLSDFKKFSNSTKPIIVTTSYLKYLLADEASGHDHLRELVHAGRLPPCPLACFFTALNPCGQPNNMLLSNFVTKFKDSEYVSVSKDNDALKEFQNILEVCYAKVDKKAVIEKEQTRREHQSTVVSMQQVPIKAMGPAIDAYTKYYGDSKDEVVSKYLKWHELIFITMRFIYDTADEIFKKQKAHYISEAFSQYELMANSPAASLVNLDVMKNKIDPAFTYSGPWLFIRSSLFLGGPLNPKMWNDEKLGVPDPGTFDDPTKLDSRELINMHAIMLAMYKEGVPAPLTLGGMREMMGGME